MEWKKFHFISRQLANEPNRLSKESLQDAFKKLANTSIAKLFGKDQKLLPVQSVILDNIAECRPDERPENLEFYGQLDLSLLDKTKRALGSGLVLPIAYVFIFFPVVLLFDAKILPNFLLFYTKEELYADAFGWLYFMLLEGWLFAYASLLFVLAISLLIHEKKIKSLLSLNSVYEKGFIKRITGIREAVISQGLLRYLVLKPVSKAMHAPVLGINSEQLAFYESLTIDNQNRDFNDITTGLQESIHKSIERSLTKLSVILQVLITLGIAAMVIGVYTMLFNIGMIF